MKLARKLASIPPVLFLRRMRSDQTLGLKSEEEITLRMIQRDRVSVYRDRYHEITEFWRSSWLFLLGFFLVYGWPFSQRIQRTLHARFTGKTGRSFLTQAYAQSAFHYAVVLMLCMHRGEWLHPFLEDVYAGLGGVKGKRVLDYGCGAGDMGLILAQRGAEVTIIDLDNRLLDFAVWRYQVRCLKCNAIRIPNTESFLELGTDNYDLVLLTEVLEHVRDPLELMKRLTGSLRRSGLLFCSMGLTFDRAAEGDHLPESLSIGNSENYRQFFESHYELAVEREGHPWLFRRKT